MKAKEDTREVRLPLPARTFAIAEERAKSEMRKVGTQVRIDVVRMYDTIHAKEEAKKTRREKERAAARKETQEWTREP